MGFKNNFINQENMNNLKPIFFVSILIACAMNSTAQNILMPQNLIVNNHVQIIEGDYPEQYKNPLLSKNFLNKDLQPNNDLSKIIGDFMVKNPQKCFNPDPLLKENFYPVAIDSFNKPADFSGLVDTVFDDVRFNYSALKSVVFSEEWAFDSKALTFSKKVNGIYPVRHFFKEYMDANGNMSASQDASISLTAFIPVIPANAQELNDAKKRMIPVKKIKYEFLMSDLYFLRWSAYTENSAIMPDTSMKNYSTSLPLDPIISLNLNPLWSTYQTQLLRKLVYNKVFVEKIPVYSLTSDAPLSQKDIASGFGYKWNEKEGYLTGEVVRITDELGNPADYSIKANLDILSNSVFSVLFEEEWMIDPQTLYMEKRVTSITPVYWQYRTNQGEEYEWQKITVFRIKLN
jgi:hypothetical protein